jgi:hypothetical protein
VIVIETSRALHGIRLEARDEIVRCLRLATRLEPDVAERARTLAEEINALAGGQTIVIDLRDARTLIEAFERRPISDGYYPDVVTLKRAVEDIVRAAHG